MTSSYLQKLKRTGDFKQTLKIYIEFDTEKCTMLIMKSG